jgi:hypothetical protein
MSRSDLLARLDALEASGFGLPDARRMARVMRRNLERTMTRDFRALCAEMTAHAREVMDFTNCHEWQKEHLQRYWAAAKGFLLIKLDGDKDLVRQVLDFYEDNREAECEGRQAFEEDHQRDE